MDLVVASRFREPELADLINGRPGYTVPPMSSSAIIVASSDQVADAATEIWLSGGSVVDAILAAAFATSAGDPSITSLAGGGFLLVRSAETGQTNICDFFSAAPGKGELATNAEGLVEEFPPGAEVEEVLLDFGEGESSQGFLVGRATAGVPGALRGLLDLARDFASMELAELLAPTVAYLENGIELSQFQVDCIGTLHSIMTRSPYARELIESAPGQAKTAGDLFRNPRLAAFFTRLGAAGADGAEQVYRDEFVTPVLDAFGVARGGLLTRGDLDEWQPIWRQPLLVEHAAAKISLNPAPSFGGPSIAETLGLLARRGIAECKSGTPERYRCLAAAFRAVSELRAEHVDLFDLADGAARLDARFDEVTGHGKGSDKTLREPRTPGNTTHISIVDEIGNAAAMTLSHGEGNGVEVPGTGMLMNNFLGEADLFPGGLGRFRPGERLRTMMAPTLIEQDDGTISVLGSGGANRIRTAIAQAAVFLIQDGLAPQDALEQARIHVEDGTLSAETFLLEDADKLLAGARGLVETCRSFEGPSLFFGGVHIAQRRADGELLAGADFRRNGTARLAMR